MYRNRRAGLSPIFDYFVTLGQALGQALTFFIIAGNEGVSLGE